MRRFVGLLALLFMAIPFGMSVSGCKKALPVAYCNAGDSGPEVGQVASITLSPTLATVGESLNFGQIGQSLSASAFDCKNNQVSLAKFVFASSNMAVADINPATGSVCAGTWNRNTGGGVGDYTTCTAFTTPPSTYLAYVTASAGGAVSNSIPVYIHPTVTSIVLGGPTPGAPGSCSTVSDPGTDCCPANSATVYNPVPPAYLQNSCVSQNSTAQLIARVYAFGGTTPADNITCQVGHLTFSLPTAPDVAQIDQNGVATANQPGSTLVAASVSNSSSASSAGFFSTCPPVSITLTVAGSTSTSAVVNINNAQPLIATVRDKNGTALNTTLSGIALEFESTTPQTAPGGGGTVTPVFPGTAAITALCQPATCNPSAFSQIGFLGNGKPIQSNPVTITTPGTSSTVIFMASTQSQYILPMDFSTGLASSQLKLPYVPNSMVISQDGSVLYIGSTQGLMTVGTTTNTLSGPNLSLPGTVLAVSPDGTTVVLTDPVRQTISLYSTGGSAVSSVTGGVGTRAVWSPDSQTVYVTTTTNTLLTHTNFTNWQSTTASETYSDAVVTVPSIGAYFAGGTPGVSGSTTDGRSYCPSSTPTTAGPPPIEANTFAPIADMDAAVTDKLGVTNDGLHILGAHAIPGPPGAPGTSTFSDLQFTYPKQTVNNIVTPQACPMTVSTGYFTSTPTTLPITSTPAINAASITGVLPTSGQVQPPVNTASTNITTANLMSLTNEYTFVTYTGTGAQLPEYALPLSGAAGTLTYVPLTGSATAPISGVWSTDNTTFYTGTSGDNEVHEITQSCVLSPAGQPTPPYTYSCKWVDSGQLTPKLPSATGGGTAPVDLIAQRPKKVTS
jgi:sugar lactone lactonase YvrE